MTGVWLRRGERKYILLRGLMSFSWPDSIMDFPLFFAIFKFKPHHRIPFPRSDFISPLLFPSPHSQLTFSSTTRFYLPTTFIHPPKILIHGKPHIQIESLSSKLHLSSSPFNKHDSFRMAPSNESAITIAERGKCGSGLLWKMMSLKGRHGR